MAETEADLDLRVARNSQFYWGAVGVCLGLPGMSFIALANSPFLKGLGWVLFVPGALAFQYASFVISSRITELEKTVEAEQNLGGNPNG